MSKGTRTHFTWIGPKVGLKLIEMANVKRGNNIFQNKFMPKCSYHSDMVCWQLLSDCSILMNLLGPKNDIFANLVV